MLQKKRISISDMLLLSFNDRNIFILKYFNYSLLYNESFTCSPCVHALVHFNEYLSTVLEMLMYGFPPHIYKFTAKFNKEIQTTLKYL